MHMIIPSRPLLLLPELAVRIGLNEAIVLQQIHFWIVTHGKERDGKLWTYNSVREWHKQFPFWSHDTVFRSLQSLHSKGLIVTGNFNKVGFDRTKWYTIDYDSPLLQFADIEYSNMQMSRVADSGKALPDDAVTNTLDYPETITYRQQLESLAKNPAIKKRVPKDAQRRTKVAVDNMPLLSDIAKAWGRREGTLFSLYELLAILEVQPTEGDVAVIGRYYQHEWPDDRDPRRRSLETLLNNWFSEVERARKWDKVHTVNQGKDGSHEQKSTLEDAMS